MGWRQSPPLPSLQRKRTTKHTTSDNRLADAVTSKLEAGNFRAARSILRSEDKTAPDNLTTFVAFQDRHPAPPHNCRKFQDHRGNLRFQPLQILTEDMEKELRTFPLSSSGGPNGVTPQHLRDLYLAPPMTTWELQSCTL